MPTQPIDNENVKVVISTRALMIEDNSLLCVASRGSENWHVPGGWLDGFESLKNCCKREVYEELGLEITVHQLVYVSEYSVHASQSRFKESVHKIEHFFHVQTTKGSIDKSTSKNTWEDRDDGLIDRVKFIPLSSIPETNILPQWLKSREIQDDIRQNSCIYIEPAQSNSNG